MPATSSRENGIHRREFLKHSAAMAGALVVGGCAGTPWGSRGTTHGVVGANGRIRLGIIGCGNLGYDSHIPKLMEMSKDPKLNIELAAVCDIYEPRKQRAKARTGAELFHDYRKMLDRRDIHGVVIVTPDHWHARMAIDARPCTGRRHARSIGRPCGPGGWCRSERRGRRATLTGRPIG